MSANLFTAGKFRAFTKDGTAPLVGGKVYTYEAGTDIPKVSYTTSQGDVPNSNPVILDGAGEANIYLDGVYDIQLFDIDDDLQWTEPAIVGSIALISTITSTSTTSVAIATGSKVFETQEAKSFSVGNFVLISSDANPVNYMHGQITDYVGTTLTVNVTSFGGSGIHSDWTIAISGPSGPGGGIGPAGPGTGDMLKSQNLSGLPDYAVARGNLGLGSAATRDVGTAPGNVVILDGTGQLSSGSLFKAWVAFDGSGGSPVILDSFNMTSVVRNSTGVYTITPSVAMPLDSKYAVSHSVGTVASNLAYSIAVTPFNATNLVLRTYAGSVGVFNDMSYVFVGFMWNH